MDKTKLVGIAKAAELLGVHPNTLRKWADEGLVQHIRLPSGYRRFDIQDLEEFKESLQVPEGKQAA
jgi:excisionase family DNA binding protein